VAAREIRRAVEYVDTSPLRAGAVGGRRWGAGGARKEAGAAWNACIAALPDEEGGLLGERRGRETVERMRGEGVAAGCVDLVVPAVFGYLALKIGTARLHAQRERGKHGPTQTLWPMDAARMHDIGLMKFICRNERNVVIFVTTPCWEHFNKSDIEDLLLRSLETFGFLFCL
jgi:hypothetical protein